MGSRARQGTSRRGSEQTKIGRHWLRAYAHDRLLLDSCTYVRKFVEQMLPIHVACTTLVPKACWFFLVAALGVQLLEQVSFEHVGVTCVHACEHSQRSRMLPRSDDVRCIRTYFRSFFIFSCIIRIYNLQRDVSRQQRFILGKPQGETTVRTVDYRSMFVHTYVRTYVKVVCICTYRCEIRMYVRTCS